MLELLEDASHAGEVIRYLARVETTEAADRLIEISNNVDGRFSGSAAIAAGWRGDRRVTDRLLDLVVEGAPYPTTHQTVFNERAIKALAVLADPTAVPRLIEYLNQATDIDSHIEFRLAEAGDLSPGAELERQQRRERNYGVTVRDSLDPGYDPAKARTQIVSSATKEANKHINVLAKTLLSFNTPAARDAVTNASRLLGRQLDDDQFRPDDAVDIDEEDCTVPAWVLDYELGDPEHPGTRFGGQPSWRTSPTWPLTPAGTPMAFWAQFEIPWATDQMAYLFIDTTEEALLDDLNQAASLFVQPGSEPQVPWISEMTGPQVPDQLQRDHRYQPAWPYDFTTRVPSLVPFNEPPDWPQGRFQATSPLNKVGGTPLAIQWEPELPTSSYRFLFQFRAHDAGFELGDVAECYGYIDTHSGNGLFHWDCH